VHSDLVADIGVNALDVVIPPSPAQYESTRGGLPRLRSMPSSKDDHQERADEEGLRKAFLTHGGELVGFARRTLRNPESADDVVQETFARAWRSRSRFDPTLGSLRTWLFAIERRVILDLVDRDVRTSTVRIDDNDEPEVEDRLESAMRGWQVESALARLQPEHRMVINELYLNGRTGREVAELYGIPEGTVRSRAFYAMRVLRVVLEEAGWDQ
jgi:RNA polymerase sigma-70 factor (ECF subfamily)